MGGKRPLSPREAKRLQARMKQVEIEGVEEVIIRFEDRETVIYTPTVMKAFILGMKESDTYQIVGEGIDRPRDSEAGGAVKAKFTDSDVELVMAQTGVTKEDATKALEDEKGDLAGAIVRLKTKK